MLYLFSSNDTIYYSYKHYSNPLNNIITNIIYITSLLLTFPPLVANHNTITVIVSIIIDYYHYLLVSHSYSFIEKKKVIIKNYKMHFDFELLFQTHSSIFEKVFLITKYSLGI
jgi:hypothetical protein